MRKKLRYHSMNISEGTIKIIELASDKPKLRFTITPKDMEFSCRIILSQLFLSLKMSIFHSKTSMTGSEGVYNNRNGFWLKTGKTLLNLVAKTFLIRRPIDEMRIKNLMKV